MTAATIVVVIALALMATGYWWRYRSLACPASLTWLIENPYMKAVAGAKIIIQRLHLDSGMNVLDVGSGPGRLSLPIAKYIGNNGEMVALDIQPKMLEKLKLRASKEGIKNIRVLEAGAGEGKTENNYFDRALIVTALGEIHDKHRALVEIYQALKQGGILSITEVIPDPHYTRLKKVRALCGDVGFIEIEEFGNRLASTVNFMKPINAQQGALADH